MDCLRVLKEEWGVVMRGECCGHTWDIKEFIWLQTSILILIDLAEVLVKLLELLLRN